MDYTTFGRTGLQISTVGIGTGGASRIGLATGSTDEQAIALVHRSIELGINNFDTADVYETEDVLGRALIGHRDEVILSTKVHQRLADGSFIDAKGLRSAIEAALQSLRTDVIDVFYIHRISLEDYDYCLSELVPAFETFRDEGLIRFIGCSESTTQDGTHTALGWAVIDDIWDAMMVGFNFFNQGVRESVLPTAIEKNIGVEVMGCARGPFSNPEQLRSEIVRFINAGLLDSDLLDVNDPLGFLLQDDGAGSLSAASYRFAQNEPGVHVVLVGTGNISHLLQNLKSFENGPLRRDDVERVRKIFGALRAERIVA